MMSVLFLMGTCGVGGVEKVSIALANEFVVRGFFVTFCFFTLGESNLLNELDERVDVRPLCRGGLSSSNCAALRKILIERRVTHIVNQWCIPYPVTRFCRKAMRGLPVKLIAVHHNLPTTNRRIEKSHGLMRKVWRFVSAVNARLAYEQSDAYVLLSESFVDDFKRFIRKPTASKLRVISNPLTLTPVVREKENVILYVGRLEETQKRFSRIIEIWREVSPSLGDWRLEVVGDGPDRGRYEREAADLERISFVGFRNPAEDYARARMLLLTSDFEGFGLVLVEAMASRCVPIVLGSYAAARDVVKDCGVVLPPPFDPNAFAQTIKRLARDPDELAARQERGLAVAAENDVKVRAASWTSLFRSCS